MEETEIIEILKDWNFWGKKKIILGKERKTYLDNAVQSLDDNDIITEVGVRRCGKSFIARQTVKYLIDRGLTANNTLIIDLNDERYLYKDYKLLLEIYKTYKKYQKPKKAQVIVIDEPQEITGWERFVRGLSERGEAKFIITGSSSKLLSSEFSTLLSGRHIVMNVMPLSFREFLAFNGLDLKNALDIDKNSKMIKTMFEDYLKYGGFPKVIDSDAKDAILTSYFDTILIKDVADRYKLRDTSKLKFLSKFYLTNIASMISYNKLVKSSAIEGRKGLSVKTIERYSKYLESSYLLFFTKRFSFSVKEQENSPRKVYSIDNGFSSAIGFNFIEMLGRLLENTVAVELLRRSYEYGKTEFYYWKSKTTNREVDFVVKDGKELFPIQVSYDINKNSEARELEGLIEAMKNLHAKTGLVITYDYEKIEKSGDLEIKFIPLWRWLLNKET